MPEQLALPFEFKPAFGFEHFHAGNNREPVAHLRAAALGRGERLIVLWGDAGSGKTHLLNACCQSAFNSGRRIHYLPLAEVRDLGPELLDGADHADLVCLDDIDRVAGDRAWEAGLFELFNRLRDADGQLILSAALPPGTWPIDLPDLASRFAWGLTLRLNPLDDADKLVALTRYATSLGMELPPAAGRYLLAHCRRDLSILRRTLDRLDGASLAAQRRLSVPFIKRVLGESS